MARPAAQPQRALFKSGAYMQNQAVRNAYYAGHYGYSYTLSNTYTQAAAKSGIVNVGGYTGTPKKKRGVSNYYQQQTAQNAPGQPFDRFGNPRQQQGDLQLAQVLMGGYQFPGQAFAPRRTKGGVFIANRLSMFIQSLGVGGISYNYLRARRRGPGQESTGWRYSLTYAADRVEDEKASSSIYQGFERYSTQETRLGTASSIDPNAGFKRLAGHAPDQHYISELSQMYKKEDTQTGPARRYERRFL